MPAFFLVFYGLIALLGLFTASIATGYLAFFGTAMIFFGVAMSYGMIKRHYDSL